MTNQEFLRALFGREASRVHVTSFMQDPSAPMTQEEHLRAWAGGYFADRHLAPGGNQYFTISTFNPDDTGRARRRKALFRATHVIVLDDVKEKLSVTMAKMLPPPTWVLETSLGSEQWGYLLASPCEDRAMVENLLDGLVASGLAPDGKDPGMKGVTRYVRLPEGYNTKASKAMFGLPFKCRMLKWHPLAATTMQVLAAPFGIDLQAPRRDARVDGAANLPDHPLLQLDDVLLIKEVRSDGRFDVRCPWVYEHTGGADDGTAVFTNADGTIGFKCHHGSCQHRTGRDLLGFLEQQQPGFVERLTTWQALRAFAGVNIEVNAGVPVTELVEEVAPSPGLCDLMDLLRSHHPNSKQAKAAASEMLRLAEGLPAMELINWHNEIKDAMGWNKSDLTKILKELRSAWKREKAAAPTQTDDFLEGLMFVAELNQFYNWKTRAFLSVEGFTNSFLHKDPEVRKSALQDQMVTKVDRLDYSPGRERVYQEGDATVGNMYDGSYHPPGVEGDCSPWLNHWDAMGWGGEAKQHMLQFMAYTILHPERKINHMILLGSKEGCGKDYLLYPLMQAMGADCKVIEGDALTETYTGFLNGVKYLHINETDLGGRREALMIANKLKPFAAAPPETLRIREMFTKPFFVKNLVNCTMTTNSRLPLRLHESRRFFALWSDLNTRDYSGQVSKQWQKYWGEQWNWMRSDGWKHCVWYLRNCVDLSTFSPGAPPPVTEFLKDIQESSKSPIQRTIEAFITDEIGNFKADLITSKEALDTLKAGDLLAPDLMHAEPRVINIHAVTTVLKDIGYPQLRARRKGETKRMWCLRDPDKYTRVADSDLLEWYLAERAKVINASPLQEVTSLGMDSGQKTWGAV